MMHLNLLQEDVQPVITRMPVAEFGGVRTGHQHGHLHEIQLSHHLTLVIDEQQAIDLCEALLDALPDQSKVGGTRSLNDQDEDSDPEGTVAP